MHRWTSEDGVEIAGDTWGEPGRLSLCCSTVAAKPGMLGKALAKPWAQRGVVAFDARGHSDSGWAAPDAYTVDHMVADLTTVCRALGSDNYSRRCVHGRWYQLGGRR